MKFDLLFADRTRADPLCFVIIDLAGAPPTIKTFFNTYKLETGPKVEQVYLHFEEHDAVNRGLSVPFFQQLYLLKGRCSMLKFN